MSTLCKTANEFHAGMAALAPAMLSAGVAGLTSQGTRLGIAPFAAPVGRPARPGTPASVQPKATTRLSACFARGADILVSLVLLTMLAPLMLLLGLLIRWDSAGPALFRQQRLGLGGKPFTMLKFRSMRLDAEAAGPIWASVADPRITRVGRFLRASRLDEVPQLLNVLRGDMALLGPRPERAHFTDQLVVHIPEFRSRLLVKPGITGWAQVNLPYGASVEDARAKLAFDLQFIQHRNLTMIVRILSRTVLVMMSRAGR